MTQARHWHICGPNVRIGVYAFSLRAYARVCGSFSAVQRRQVIIRKYVPSMTRTPSRMCVMAMLKMKRCICRAALLGKGSWQWFVSYGRLQDPISGQKSAERQQGWRCVYPATPDEWLSLRGLADSLDDSCTGERTLLCGHCRQHSLLLGWLPGLYQEPLARLLSF